MDLIAYQTVNRLDQGIDRWLEEGNIQEAESSLKEGSSLNFEVLFDDLPISC